VLWIAVLGLFAILLDDGVATQASPASEARPLGLTPPEPVELTPPVSVELASANEAIELTPPMPLVPVELSRVIEVIERSVRTFATTYGLMREPKHIGLWPRRTRLCSPHAVKVATTGSECAARWGGALRELPH
jgi:hypothetical protein